MIRGLEEFVKQFFSSVGCKDGVGKTAVKTTS